MTGTPTFTGRCYCGDLQYEATGKPMAKAQCHCRECQYITGGAPSYFLVTPIEGFSWTKGTPQKIARSDLDAPVTRWFCGTCGTHLMNKSRDGLGAVIKVGTLDDPSVFGASQVAIFTIDQQSFHTVPDGIPAFERRP